MSERNKIMNIIETDLHPGRFKDAINVVIFNNSYITLSRFGVIAFTDMADVILWANTNSLYVASLEKANLDIDGIKK
jgi:hypothetical protein